MSCVGPIHAATSGSLSVTITPRDAWPPAAVTDLAATPGAEGQVLLQWTAPDGNSDAFPVKTAVASYALRFATTSADAVGSTTTWWGSAFPLGVPAPSPPGSLQFIVAFGLEPGATIYAGVRSLDGAGNASEIDARSSTPGQQARALVFDAPPPAPASLSVADTSSGSVTLSWSAVAAPDLESYRVHVDSTPPYDFADAFVLAASSASPSFVHSGLTGDTSYFYFVTALDKGAPSHLGVALESPPSNAVGAFTALAKREPLAPYGVDIATSAGTATLSWYAVRAFADGGLFIDPGNPLSSELTGYRVYRATAPYGAPWVQVATRTPVQLGWTDAAAVPGTYYELRAENASSLSRQSMVMGHDGTGWVVCYDGASTLRVPPTVVDDLRGASPDQGYLVDTSSRAWELGGRVFASMEFRAWRGGLSLDPDKRLPTMGNLRLHYATSAGGGLVAAGLGPSAVPAMPENLGVYWFNGLKWLQLFGVLDPATQAMTLQTPYLGAYQLRTVMRSSDFRFDHSGVTTRQITPNGDGKNDTVVFLFDNPRDSGVTGRIFDLRGFQVAEMGPGPVPDSLSWDGKAGGRAVPSGVYVYVIESEGQVFNGTIVVIR